MRKRRSRNMPRRAVQLLSAAPRCAARQVKPAGRASEAGNQSLRRVWRAGLAAPARRFTGRGRGGRLALTGMNALQGPGSPGSGVHLYMVSTTLDAARVSGPRCWK